MVKAELIKRSPLRLLEKTTHGGLGLGELGLVTSLRGVGKTACLVHLATDQLFQGRQVIHVSFAENTDHIVRWYETIFREISEKRSLESAVDIHDDLIKNRVIMTFKQTELTSSQLIKSLDALIADAKFAAKILIVDGYDFKSGSLPFISDLKSYAAEKALVLWMSADTDSDSEVSLRKSDLNAYLDSADVLIHLNSKGDHMCLKLLKDHETFIDKDLHLKLDAKTLLIADQSEID